MTDRELMQQALEALCCVRDMVAHPDNLDFIDKHTAALRERLAQPEQKPFCYHDGRNIVGKEYADHSDVFPLYTSPNPEQQKPVIFNCTVIDDAHLNGVPLSQWGKQHEMQPCAGRNCGSTNPNLHSAECFEDYEKSTGMNQWQGLTDEEINSVRHNRDWTAHWTDATFARAIEAKLREKNYG